MSAIRRGSALSRFRDRASHQATSDGRAMKNSVTDRPKSTIRIGKARAISTPAAIGTYSIAHAPCSPGSLRVECRRMVLYSAGVLKAARAWRLRAGNGGCTIAHVTSKLYRPAGFQILGGLLVLRNTVRVTMRLVELVHQFCLLAGVERFIGDPE